MKRVWLVREAFLLLDFEDPSTDPFKTMLLSCTLQHAYLNSEEVRYYILLTGNVCTCGEYQVCVCWLLLNLCVPETGSFMKFHFMNCRVESFLATCLACIQNSWRIFTRQSRIKYPTHQSRLCTLHLSLSLPPTPLTSSSTISQFLKLYLLCLFSTDLYWRHMVRYTTERGVLPPALTSNR